MSPDQVTELIRLLLREALILSAPVLGLATVVSLVVSLVLTVFSLQDQTLSTVPRLCIVGFAVMISAPWMIRRLVTFSVLMLGDFHRFTR